MTRRWMNRCTISSSRDDVPSTPTGLRMQRPPPRPSEAERASFRVQGRKSGRRLHYEACRLSARRSPLLRPFTRRALRLFRGVAGFRLNGHPEERKRHLKHRRKGGTKP